MKAKQTSCSLAEAVISSVALLSKIEVTCAPQAEVFAVIAARGSTRYGNHAYILVRKK
jgi:hypothetical protein